MRKKIIFTLLGIMAIFIVLAIIGVGISKISKPQDPEDIITTLSKKQGYKSDVTIEVVNDMQTLVYKGHQVYKKDVAYKLDLNEGRTFTFRGDEVTVVDKENKRDYKVDKAFDEVLKYGFIGEYIGLIYTNEDIGYKKETINDEELLLIEVLIPGSNRNLFKGIMYVSIKDNLPKKLVIYDEKEKERVRYTYDNFNWTEKINNEEL